MRKNYTTYNRGRITLRSRKKNRHYRKAWKLFRRHSRHTEMSQAELDAFYASLFY